MYQFTWAILFLLPQLAFCQLNDSFADGDFSNDPKWSGDTSLFIINSGAQLQSQGLSGSGSIYLSTVSERLKNTTWEFWINLPFSSSTTNYTKIYIASDNPELTKNLNGYYIKVGGESGNGDGIDLFRQNGVTSTKIIDGIAGHAGKSNNKLRIKVLRDFAGNWKLYSDTTGGYNYSFEGNVFDTIFTTSLYTGIVYQYTSTRRNQFYFDDYIIQQAPLCAENAKAINDSTIEINFNNPLTLSFLTEIQNFTLLNTGTPVRISSPRAVSVWLTFPFKIPDGKYELEIKNIKDTGGNLLSYQILPFNFKAPLHYGDIIITEIYPDPSPSNGLSGEEFIEVYNTTRKTIDLDGFQLLDPGTIATINNISIEPKGYVILTTAEGKTEYEGIAAAIALTPWPSLNNSGDNITLKDKDGNIIFNLNYTSQWYKDKEKQEGGWTLEMINLNEQCKGADNWAASINPIGGSPGQVNSINDASVDNTGPEVLESNLEDSTIVNILFNENLSSDLFTGNFICENNLLLQTEKKEKNLILHWQNAFPANSKSTISFSKIEDCLGNRSEGEIEIIRPGKLDSLDIIINEILFNPKPTGIDFVEIYNRSSDIIDLKDVFLLSIKENNQIISAPVSLQHLYIYPNSYKVLCQSSEILRNNYSLIPQENIIELPGFPSYNDDYGKVALLSATGNLIDLLAYKDSYHSVFLKDKEGISLERISFELSTNYPGNWHSASSLSGFATPGYLNSMHYESASEQMIKIEPKVITPNGDSEKDLAYINFKFRATGNYCSIKIFNSSGFPVRELADNDLTGEEGFFTWDGADDKGKIVPSGIYILLIEYFHPSGEQRKWKQSLVVYSD